MHIGRSNSFSEEASSTSLKRTGERAVSQKRERMKEKIIIIMLMMIMMWSKRGEMGRKEKRREGKIGEGECG